MGMGLKAGMFYECGPFRLEPAEHRLMRGGTPVSLPPKAFDLLVFLVRNTGRLVTKEEIMRAVWPGSFVEEANLTVSISFLRKVLCEKESNLRYIETVPKRGYRFTASVKELPGPQELPAKADFLNQTRVARLQLNGSAAAVAVARLAEDADKKCGVPGKPGTPVSSRATSRPVHHFRLMVVVVVACIVTILSYRFHLLQASALHPSPLRRSLAILPLRNVRQNPEDDFLGYSLADAVITKLDPVSSLNVRPSSAVEKYKGQAIDLHKVAADLRVDTLLTGNFIHEGDNLRISYQLIDVKTQKILGTDMIDLKYDKLLTVQDNVSQQIIKGLALNLSPAEVARIVPGEPVNAMAYESYLRGVDLVGSHDFPLAIKMLEKSSQIDPNYALTWAYLGQSYESAANFEFGGKEQFQKAQTAYERALALQPNQLEANMFLANLLIDTGKVEQATVMLRDTLKNNPNYAPLHWELGYAYRFAGMLKESAAECERARAIDPQVKSNGAALNAYLYLGEYDKFLHSLPEGNESPFILFYRGFGEYHKKDWARAARHFDRAVELDSTLYTQIGKVFSDSIAQRNSDGIERLHDLESKIERNGVADPEATYKIAQAYAALNDKTSALRMLRYSIEHGFFAYAYFVTDPLIASTRNEPEFAQLMKVALDRQTAFKKMYF